jgi:hypothetical protein
MTLNKHNFRIVWYDVLRYDWLWYVLFKGHCLVNCTSTLQKPMRDFFDGVCMRNVKYSMCSELCGWEIGMLSTHSLPGLLEGEKVTIPQWSCGFKVSCGFQFDTFLTNKTKILKVVAWLFNVIHIYVYSWKSVTSVDWYTSHAFGAHYKHARCGCGEPNARHTHKWWHHIFWFLVDTSTHPQS